MPSIKYLGRDFDKLPITVFDFLEWKVGEVRNLAQEDAKKVLAAFPDWFKRVDKDDTTPAPPTPTPAVPASKE